MMSSAAKTAALLICALLLPRAAGAACGDLDIKHLGDMGWHGATGSSYDVFDPVEYVQVVTFKVRKRGGGTCAYLIGATEGGAGIFTPRELQDGSDFLAYNLYDTAAQSNVLMDLADGGALIAGQFSISDASQETNTHSYYFVIPRLQVVPAGRYGDRPTFRLYEAVGGDFVERDERSRNHRARVAEAVELALVETGSSFAAGSLSKTLDFGILTEGEWLGLDLRVRGNTGFVVSLRSLNRGVMAHASGYSSVPYLLQSEGVPVDLGSGATVRIGSFTGEKTSIDGERYTIAVRIGSLAGTVSGLHEDQLIVTVTAK